MKIMTKNEFREFARKHGYVANYSGKLRKFFIKKFCSINIHSIINSKS